LNTLAKVFCFLVLSTVLLAPAAMAQEVRIAFVNTPQILEEAPQAKAARERLEREFAPRDSEIATTQNALKELEERLSRDGAVMSAEERRKTEREILSQQREIKRAREAFTEDLNLRRNEEFSRLQRVISAAIVALAKERGYDLILESGVVYASEAVDITDEVLGYLQKQLEQDGNGS